MATMINTERSDGKNPHDLNEYEITESEILEILEKIKKIRKIPKIRKLILGCLFKRDKNIKKELDYDGYYTPSKNDFEPKPIPEEKPKPKSEEKPKPKLEEKPKPKLEEKPKPKLEEKPKPKLEEEGKKLGEKYQRPSINDFKGHYKPFTYDPKNRSEY